MDIVELVGIASVIGLGAVIAEIVLLDPRALAEMAADSERFARAPRPAPTARRIAVPPRALAARR
jgi:hypothetical protein